MKGFFAMGKALSWKLLCIVLIGLVSLLIANRGASGATIKPKTLIWGSASLGSSGYVIIEALASTLNKYEKSFRNASISTQGGIENLVLLSQEEIHLGQTVSSDLYLAYEGQKPFQKRIEFCQLFSYAYWGFPIAVPEDSPMKTIEDLAGKRVCMGPAGGSTLLTWQTVFEANGIKVNPVYFPWQGGADAFKTGQIDALVVIHVGPRTLAPAFVELAHTRPYRLLGTEVEKIRRGSEKNPGIIAVKVGDKQILNVPGTSGILAADPRIDEEIIYKVVSTLYGKEEEVRKIAKELEFFRLDFALEMIIPKYPVHKGAAKYYKEKGLWKDHLIISE